MSDKNLIEEYFAKETSKKRRKEIKSQIFLLPEDNDDRIAMELGDAAILAEEIDQLKLRMVGLHTSGKQPKNYLKIAASVTLLAVSTFLIFRFFFYDTPSNEQVFLSFFEPYDGVVITRGSEASITKGMDHYNSGEY